MNIRLYRERNYCLQKGERLVFKAVEVRLKCERGILWITWPGSGDIVIHGGESVQTGRHGIVCVSSFSDSEFIISGLKESTMIKKIIGRLFNRLLLSSAV